MDLTKYTVQQLKGCLTALNEQTSGNKNDLIMRLSRLDQETVSYQLANVVSGSKGAPTDNLLDVSINESTEVVNGLKGEINALKGTVEALVRQLQLVVTDVQRTAALSSGMPTGAAATGNESNEDHIETVVTEISATSAHANTIPTNDATTIENNDSRANYQEPLYTMQRMGQQQSVKEIASILPDFDPGNDSYTSRQFIERIEQLKEVYGWNDAILLFAVLGKLKGAAKCWADAQPVFRHWRQFVVTFTNDFPCTHNKANTHIIMMNMKMGRNEKIIDYYYRMLALGRRDEIDDASIIQYIINGLQDFRLKQMLCVMTFNSCADLLKSISSSASSFASQPSLDRKWVENSKYEKPGQKQVDQNNHVFKSERNDANRGYKGIVCFNCRNRGHISRNCPQARRNQKPSEKINNITKEDASTENADEAQINSIATVKPQELLKEIIILEKDPIYIKGLMDSGSAKSLIKRSIANKCKEKAMRCNSKLTGFAGGSVVCSEMKHLNVKIDSVEYGADFLVIEDRLMSHDVLIGLDILSMGTVLIKNGICQMMTIKDTPIDIGQELTDSQTQKFYDLVDKFSDTFGEKLTELGKAKNLTKKTADFVWSNECEDAFHKLITNLTSKPVLAIYDMNAEHQLHTDASSVGIGAILMQLDKDNAWHPVAYFSRCCNPAERNYGPYELEVLAIVEGCERFRMYLLGKFFQIVSDCQAISTVKLSKAMVPRIARWFLKLSEYDYEVVHRPGDAMRHVDALSRAPVVEMSIEGELKVLNITTDDWVAALQCSDEKLKEIIHVLKGNLQSPQKKQIEAEFVLKNHRLYHKIKNQPLALVVPKGVRWRLVKLFHDDAGHVACENVLKRMGQHFWFSRMRNFVKSYIRSCLECVYHKEPNRKQCELFGMDVPRIPFEVLHLDRQIFKNGYRS